MQLIVLSLLCTVCAGAAIGGAVTTDTAATAERLDSDLLLRSVGSPECMRKCIDPFIRNLTALWDMEEVVEHSEAICKSHSDAMSCLAADQFCDYNKVFATATAGVRHRCEKQATSFGFLADCMKGKTDSILKKCDQDCQLRGNLTAFSENPNVKLAAQLGGNVFIVSDHLGDLCGSLTCLIGCVTNDLNAACELSGWLTLDVMLQPFDAVSGLLDTMAPSIRDMVRNKLDKRCHFAIDSQKLMKIRQGHFTDI